MAITQLSFPDFNKYLKKCNSVLELGNQIFVKECIEKYNSELSEYNHTTPVKKYCENKGKKHVSIDITGFDNSLAIDLNNQEIPNIGEFDLVTNFGTSEHIEPNQYEAFLHIHNLCKIGGIMLHEVPVVGGWIGHCKFYYDEDFFINLSNENDYEILEMKMNKYDVGNLIFVALLKKNKKFNSNKKQLESNIHVSTIAVNISEYWKK